MEITESLGCTQFSRLGVRRNTSRRRRFVGPMPAPPLAIYNFTPFSSLSRGSCRWLGCYYPIPLRPAPSRIVPPDRTICRVTDGAPSCGHRSPGDDPMAEYEAFNRPFQAIASEWPHYVIPPGHPFEVLAPDCPCSFFEVSESWTALPPVSR